jgi:hypothetical protein
MRKLLLIASAALVALADQPLYATNVCANVSGLWDSTGSPYYVTCDVAVPAGDTLVIQPGVCVQFMGQFQFLVNGILRAIGTVSDSIRFTTDTIANPSCWKGIRMIGASDSCLLAYCIVEDAHWPGSLGDGGGGIVCQYCSPTISSSIIQRCTTAREGGGLLLLDSDARVLNCHVLSNYGPYGGGITGGTTNPDSGTTNPLIEHCLIAGNGAGQGGGVAFWEGTIMVVGCTVVGNHGGDAGGIRVCYRAQVIVNNTIIANNTIAGMAILDGPRATIAYSCFWQNSVVGTTPAGFGSLIQTNANSDSCDASYNIFLDPMFVNATAGDYDLLSESACIDAGDPTLPGDPDSTIADIGAFPYYHPCLTIDPASLDFGLLDLGTDSTMEIVLHNPTSQAIAVTDVSCSLPEFSFDTTGMGGQVAPFATYDLEVTFHPLAAGSYADTLVIVVQQECDTLIRIPLHGEAGVILPAVEGLVIQKGAGNDIQLDWQPVTHSISGQPLESVGYTIYGSTTREGPYVPFGYVTTNSFVHSNILSSRPTYFYYVTADIPSRRR